MLRPDKNAFSFSAEVTTNALESTDKFLRTATKSFVFGASNFKSSRTTKLFSITFEDNADLIAKRRTFLGNLYA